MKYLYIILLFFLTITYGCKKDSEGLTRITYYPELTLTGDLKMIIPVGGTFVEPGYSAIENGTDVTDKVVVDQINTNVAGYYQVTYSIENSDGIAAELTRDVIVYMVNAAASPASGTYVADAVRTEADGSDPRPRIADISITHDGAGVYSVNCLLGNFYAVGSGYGPDYAMVGKIQLNPDNTLTLMESSLAGWGDALAGFQNGIYDPVTGILQWESIYAGNDTFTVTCYLKTKN